MTLLLAIVWAPVLEALIRGLRYAATPPTGPGRNPARTTT